MGLDGAERDFRRVIELNPNYAHVRANYWFLLAAMKRPEEARAQIERALESDPLNPMFQGLLGWQFRVEGRLDHAILQNRRTLRKEPSFPAPHGSLWVAFRQKQMDEEALAEAKSFFALLGDREVADTLARGYAAGGGYSLAMR